MPTRTAAILGSYGNNSGSKGDSGNGKGDGGKSSSPTKGKNGCSAGNGYPGQTTGWYTGNGGNNGSGGNNSGDGGKGGKGSKGNDSGGYQLVSYGGHGKGH